MSSGHGFDFFGFEWWYSFNKKTFRSFTFLWERKKVRIFFNFFKKKKRKKKEVEGSLFFCFSQQQINDPLKRRQKFPRTTWNVYSRNRSRSFFVDFKTSIVDSFSGSSVAFSHSSYCFRVGVLSVYYMRFCVYEEEGILIEKRAKVNHLKQSKSLMIFTW